jgi:hypothetical protein
MGHISNIDLQAKIDALSSEIIVGGQYVHWRNPDSVYEVISLALSEWDEEVVVIYLNLDSGITWVRKVYGEDGWLTEVLKDDDSMGSRFILLT